MNTTDNKKINASATFACIGVLFCWSLGPILIKLLTGYTDPWIQNLLRYAVSCLFWLPFLLYAFKTKKVDKTIWMLSIAPACANIVMQSCWAAAFYFLEPAFVNLINKSTVLWVALFSLIFFPEERRLLKSSRFLIGSALAVAGVIGVIISSHDFNTKATITGVMIALSASVMWGVYTIIVKKSFKNIDSRYGFGVISIYTVAGLFILASIFGDMQDCTNLGPKPWLYIIVSSIFSIALGHVLYFVAIKRIGAMIPTLSILATPFIVLLMSTHIFGETLSLLQIVFGVILLIGSAIAIWSQEHLQPKEKRQKP